MQLEEALVDASEFFGAEVLVVDGAAGAVLGGEGQRADGGEQRAVGELAGVEVGGGALEKRKPPSAGSAMSGAPSSPSQPQMRLRVSYWSG